jgi:hypothetical protein
MLVQMSIKPRDETRFNRFKEVSSLGKPAIQRAMDRKMKPATGAGSAITDVILQLYRCQQAAYSRDK